jgi:autotransporter translocation and assembly factor TamB
VTGNLIAARRGDRTTVTLQPVRVLDAEAEGTVTMDARNRLSGEIRAAAGNLAGTVAGLEAFLGRPDLVETRVDGTANIVATLGGTLQKPAVDATVQAPSLALGTLEGVALNLDASYQPSQLVIRDAAIRWREQTATARGAIGLTGPTRPLNLTANVQGADLSTVLAGLGRPDIPAQGTISVAATVGGTVESPDANLTVTGTNLQAYNEPLGNLSAQARLQNRVLQVDQLRLDKQEGSLTATGSYNLDTKAYTVEADGRNLHLRQLTLPNGIPVRGEVNLSAKGSGTIDNPNLAMQLDIDNLQVREDSIGSVDASVNVAGQQANIEAKAPGYNLEVKAVAGTKDPYPTTFEIALNGADLS